MMGHPIQIPIEIVCEGCGATTPAKAKGGVMNLRNVIGADPAWLVHDPFRGDQERADPRTRTWKGQRKQTVLCPTCLASPPPTPEYPDIAAMRRRKGRPPQG